MSFASFVRKIVGAGPSAEPHKDALVSAQQRLRSMRREGEGVIAAAKRHADDLVRDADELAKARTLEADAAGASQTAVAALTEELRKQKRVADEYFAVIETVLKERDTWKEMWQTQSRDHLNAQVLLEQALVQTREMLVRAVGMVNAARRDLNVYREREGLAPLALLKDLPKSDGTPVGTAAQFGAAMRVLEAAKSPDSEPLAERAKIAISAASDPIA